MEHAPLPSSSPGVSRAARLWLSAEGGVSLVLPPARCSSETRLSCDASVSRQHVWVSFSHRAVQHLAQASSSRNKTQVLFLSECLALAEVFPLGANRTSLLLPQQGFGRLLSRVREEEVRESGASMALLSRGPGSCPGLTRPRRRQETQPRPCRRVRRPGWHCAQNAISRLNQGLAFSSGAQAGSGIGLCLPQTRIEVTQALHTALALGC